MKVFLMHPDRDAPVTAELPSHHEVLTADLELETLLAAMAAGDAFLYEVARRALLLGLRDPEEIRYRQQALVDCLNNPALIRELYDLAGEAIGAQKRVWGFLQDSPSTVLSRSVEKMTILLDYLRRLRSFCDEHAGTFPSPAFTRFFAMLREELDEPYFAQIDAQLKELRFKNGKLLSARLGTGNRGVEYVLRQPREQGWLGRMFDRSGYSFTIPERDNNGFKALSELEDRGLNLVANALAQSVDHVVGFLVMLRTEAGFYLSCVNLSQALSARGRSTTLPRPLPAGETALSAQLLYDISLSLATDQPVVANDLAADGKTLVMITGANQGGKSTLLRSIGVAQLMMQAGMFVGAAAFQADICQEIFTHYKREEDEDLESGKLDEELSRMSGIADHIGSQCLLLCNESFASTNEREGSEIARQVVRAMLDGGIKVAFVTHMFDLADGLYRDRLDTALFLRAQRGTDGKRSYKLCEGDPLPTSFGEDSYERVFGRPLRAEAPAVPKAKPPQPAAAGHRQPTVIRPAVAPAAGRAPSRPPEQRLRRPSAPPSGPAR